MCRYYTPHPLRFRQKGGVDVTYCTRHWHFSLRHYGLPEKNSSNLKASATHLSELDSQFQQHNISSMHLCVFRTKLITDRSFGAMAGDAPKALPG